MQAPFCADLKNIVMSGTMGLGIPLDGVTTPVISMPKPSSTHLVVRFLEQRLRVAEPGAALPPTRQIMQQCGVGPHSVTAAVDSLKRRGLLDVRPSNGLYRPMQPAPKAPFAVDLVYFVIDPGMAQMIRGATPADDSFHGQVIDRFKSLSVDRDMALRVHVADGEENSYTLCQRLSRDARVKACITVSVPELSMLRVLVDAYLPVVNLFPSSFALPENSVTTDPDAVVACQMKPLLEHGHRRIAYLHNVQKAYPHRDLQLRREAFYRMCAENGLKLASQYVHFAGWDRNFVDQVVREVLGLDPRPTAVICADQHLPSVYAAAGAVGLSIPRDLSVVGTDDKPISQQVQPSATTVRVPRREAVEAAFDLLNQVMNGRVVPSGDFVEAPVAIVMRGSVSACLDR
jgi:DNA-binding LacI/PurR family transcriptional regulator